MTRATIAGGACVTALAFLALALVVRYPALEQNVEPAGPTPLAITAEVHPGFIYGRITDVDGATYEGRLRWGGDQEAFWGDYFNGTRDANPWAVHAPLERPPKERIKIEIFGFKIGGRDGSAPRRLFMARFGDIARIEAHFGDVQVTLKSGTVFELDRFSAGDIDDGVRVWDSRRGVVDLDARRIRTIEFLPTDIARRRLRSAARHGAHAAGRLHRLHPVGPAGRRRRRRARAAAPPTVSSACATTRSAPSRAARATAPW